jgi:hypothetical protein
MINRRKVDGHSSLIRDMNVGSIVNVDENEYNKYIMIKRKREHNEQEILNLKSEVSEIKNILNQLLEKL